MRLPATTKMPLRGYLHLGTALFAAAGSNQATATRLTSQVSVVTAADGAKGVALPAAELGKAVFVINTVTTLGLLVYPGVGFADTINGGSANVHITLGPGQAAWFIPVSATAWWAADASTSAAILSGLTATAAEINRATDLSARVVPLAVTTILTEVAHEGRTIVISGAGGARTFTLPAATGGGGRYRFVVNEVNTSNYLIKAAVGTDLFEGAVIMISDAGDAVEAFEAGATDDTVTLNGTTTGGAAVGDWIEFEDISATGWAVRGVLTGTGDEVTPFSDTVA